MDFSSTVPAITNILNHTVQAVLMQFVDHMIILAQMGYYIADFCNNFLKFLCCYCTKFYMKPLGFWPPNVNKTPPGIN